MTNTELEAVTRLNRDIRDAAKTLDRKEARFLVDAYYIAQENRIRADGQIRAMADEPNNVLNWLSDQNTTLETQLKGALDKYTAAQPIGQWARSIKGVGPVIAAGLIAHIDINKAATVSQIWRYAGLDPSTKWNKGEKRPWNADLKVLCYKLGESFVKVSGYEDAFYGKVYRDKKDELTAKNDAGGFAETAARSVYGEKTQAAKHVAAGRLPPAQIHARARRYAVKLFLSHFHAKWRELEGLPVPVPYAIAHLEHAHMIDVPDGSMK
jgi:hypothetical protein